MPTNIQTGTLLAQTLDGIDGPTNTNIIYGDANKLKGNSVGGADTITGGDDGAINYIYGDACSMEGKSKGGADYLIGGANGSTNYIFGDAYSMKGKVVGGNDLLVGVNVQRTLSMAMLTSCVMEQRVVVMNFILKMVRSYHCRVFYLDRTVEVKYLNHNRHNFLSKVIHLLVTLQLFQIAMQAMTRLT